MVVLRSPGETEERRQQGQVEGKRESAGEAGEASEQRRGGGVFLGLPPQLGEAAAPMEIPGAGLAASAERTRPTGGRPREHLLEASWPMLAGAPEGRRHRRERGRSAAADHLRAEDRRRELRGEVRRKEQRRRRRLDGPEAGAGSWYAGTTKKTMVTIGNSNIW